MKKYEDLKGRGCTTSNEDVYDLYSWLESFEVKPTGNLPTWQEMRDRWHECYFTMDGNWKGFHEWLSKYVGQNETTKPNCLTCGKELSPESKGGYCSKDCADKAEPQPPFTIEQVKQYYDQQPEPLRSILHENLEKCPKNGSDTEGLHKYALDSFVWVRTGCYDIWNDCYNSNSFTPFWEWYEKQEVKHPNDPKVKQEEMCEVDLIKTIRNVLIEEVAKINNDIKINQTDLAELKAVCGNIIDEVNAQRRELNDMNHLEATTDTAYRDRVEAMVKVIYSAHSDSHKSDVVKYSIQLITEIDKQCG